MYLSRKLVLYSIGKVERYHAPLRRAYEILRTELDTGTSDAAVLQIAVKAVNDTAGPDGLVPTLLVFGAYPWISIDSPLSPSITHRAEAIQKAIRALRKAAAEHTVSNALGTRNRPTTDGVLSLPLQSEVIVWREKNRWQGPYRVIDMNILVNERAGSLSSLGLDVLTKPNELSAQCALASRASLGIGARSVSLLSLVGWGGWKLGAEGLGGGAISR
ncbi:hypothetical protein PtrM4_026370 [Pyrenophora tritici-repentis]|uniref:Uncharacterized protein n=1 Tax=Pyrenophora tritici-repentis TaxID=45151 RepID=A0A834SA33_9PLEO|nr:hypothetical protein PtrM4_026370 [Pyrenophora tritici-repentis]